MPSQRPGELSAAQRATATPDADRSPDADKSSRSGPVLLLIGFAGIAVTALLGPSAAEAPLGAHDNPATPPWHLHANPPAWLVTVLVAVAVLAGAAALALGLTGRWRPRPRRLLAAGVLATAVLAVLPPIGSADPLSYAAYGRMVATGHDPYTTTPAQLAARGDPVGRAVELPWQHTPSVYGPLASAEQGAASELAGHDTALTVLLLDLVGAAAFFVAGLMLHRTCRGESGRRRAALLWTANPLLWLQLVAGAHLDVFAAAFAVSAIAVARRSRFAAGVLAGAATAVKAPAGLVALALLWAARRSRRAAAEVIVGVGLVAGTGYAVAGSAALRQLRRAAAMVSLATPWRPLSDLTDPGLGHASSRHLLGALSVVLFLVLVAALARRQPAVRTGDPAAVATVLLIGYVLAATYALPWYDATAWALLPLLAASRLDAVVLAHTTVLSLAYLPGRAAVALHGWLHTVTSGMRSVASPALVTALLAAVILAGVWQRSRPRAA